jgi:hypothetical protein
MEKQDKAGVLLKEKEYVRFDQLLKRAASEGRLDGTSTCNLCGMKYHTEEEAKSCCSISVS